MNNLPKVAIVGSGNVGSNAALLVGAANIADLVLVDIADGLAKGRALDIAQAMSALGVDAQVEGGSDYSVIEGVKVVVITAGLPRRPGMSREDLLEKNAGIIRGVVKEIKQYAPGAFVIVVTNPLDVMAHLAYREMDVSSNMVMGMGGLLDSARFKHFVSRATGSPYSLTEAMVIGAHSDEMVPLVSRVSLGGGREASSEALAGAAEKARHGGAEIVGLLKTGSAAYAPGAAISLMVKSILLDEKKVFSTCCKPSGEYGISDIYINLPAVLGAGGVEQIVELELTSDEYAALNGSADAIRRAVFG